MFIFTHLCHVTRDKRAINTGLQPEKCIFPFHCVKGIQKCCLCHVFIGRCSVNKFSQISISALKTQYLSDSYQEDGDLLQHLKTRIDLFNQPMLQ